MTEQLPTLSSLLAAMRTHPFAPGILAVSDARIAALYRAVSGRLHPLLARQIGEAATAAMIRQLVPKAVAFCAALGCDYAPETADPLLADLGVAIAIIYLIDHGIDRDHFAMTAAARGWLDGASTGLFHDLEAMIQQYAHPDDRERIAALARDIIDREIQTAQASQHYLQDTALFWQNHGTAFVANAVLNGGLLFVVMSLYSVVRQYRPQLRSIEACYRADMETVFLGPVSTLIRIVDDWGDRQIDSGDNPTWGLFTLNIFNNGMAHPEWAMALARYAGMAIPDAWSTLLHTHPAQAIEQLQELVQERFRTLTNTPHPDEDALLLIYLARAVTQAGLVNARGDQDLCA